MTDKSIDDLKALPEPIKEALRHLDLAAQVIEQVPYEALDGDLAAIKVRIDRHLMQYDVDEFNVVIHNTWGHPDPAEATRRPPGRVDVVDPDDPRTMFQLRAYIPPRHQPDNGPVPPSITPPALVACDSDTNPFKALSYNDALTKANEWVGGEQYRAIYVMGVVTTITVPEQPDPTVDRVRTL